jgi:ABC-type lipoprotein export system ATPase subunit
MMLRLDRVSKRFSRPSGDRVALDDLSLELDCGQIMGIFGPSGSGKTTLLRIAVGLQKPDSGTVIYNGERLDQMSAKERTRFRRREIACVWAAQSWQERLSVLDHVAIPLLVDRCGHRSAERRVREALLACEAEQCVDMELHELSDGERQRVAIARALVTEPRLLLADGPASSLSLVEQEQIMVLLSSLAREARVAVLITDSNAESLLRADPILYLRDGKLINPEPMSERGRIYRFPSIGSRPAAADA